MPNLRKPCQFSPIQSPQGHLTRITPDLPTTVSTPPSLLLWLSPCRLPHELLLLVSLQVPILSSLSVPSLHNLTDAHGGGTVSLSTSYCSLSSRLKSRTSMEHPTCSGSGTVSAPLYCSSAHVPPSTDDRNHLVIPASALPPLSSFSLLKRRSTPSFSFYRLSASV